MTTTTLGALAPALTTLRLSLHVLAATIWVGGQFTVAGLLPTLRRLGEDAPRQVARAFGKLEWPAYVLLVATGVWNISAAGHESATWNAVLGAKIAVVVVAGAAAIVHTRARSRAAVGAYGGIAGLASIVAVILGVLLAG